MKTIQQIAEEGFFGIPKIKGISAFVGFVTATDRYVKDKTKYKPVLIDSIIEIECRHRKTATKIRIHPVNESIDFIVEMYNAGFSGRWFTDGDCVKAEDFIGQLKYYLKKLYTICNARKTL